MRHFIGGSGGVTAIESLVGGVAWSKRNPRRAPKNRGGIRSLDGCAARFDSRQGEALNSSLSLHVFLAVISPDFHGAWPTVIEVAHHWSDGHTMKNDGDQDDESKCAPQKVRSLQGDASEAVREVIGRANTADTEEGDERLYVCRLRTS